MRQGVRLFAVCLLSCVASLAAPVVSLGASASPQTPAEGEGVDAASQLGAPFVVSGSPTEPQQLQAEQEAKRANPEAARGREESESAYENLTPRDDQLLANRTEPSLVHEPAGGPPTLPDGLRILGFPTDYSMSVEGSDGAREAREGVEPVALEATPGKRSPIDLGLVEVGGAFQPQSGLAPIRIPKHLREGAALTDAGISLTPVDAQGAALGGEGVLDGTGVFYGDTEDANQVIDVDTFVKPSTFGLMMETSLRSQRSPSRLFFKVTLPEGATLEQESPGSGPARVDRGSNTLALILAPSAHDAEGASVPVSMTVQGDTLVVTVEHPAGAYAYPIAVDPRYEYYASEFTWDKQVNKSPHPTNWHFEHAGSLFTGAEASGGQGWTIQVAGSHGEHEEGWMVYTTQGLSHIWDFASQTAQHESGTRVETRAELNNKSGTEREVVLSTEVSEPTWNVPPYCRMGEACKVTPENGNSATYVALASGPGTGVAGENIFHNAEVAIQQEGNPEATFDTTDATVSGHPNALYGAGTWLGPHTTALVKFTASDKGIGIEGWRAEHTKTGGGWEHLAEKSMQSEGLCSGIQCPSVETEYVGYSSALPDGEPSLGLDTWNAMYDSHATENEAEGLRHHVVKVDSTPPTGLALTGLPAGNEITPGEYDLKAEATDGSGTTPSSGVKSIALLIDGREVDHPTGSCEAPKSSCAAHADFGLVGSEYATGKHAASLVVTDNAGNVATGGEITFTVHPASSAPVGPGSVNLATGEFSLGSTDVSLDGGLHVGRSYASRHFGAGGPSGPLGPQWGLSLGGQESLVKQPNESMVLTSASGVQTTFASDKKGGFESPKGDANLALTFGEPEGIKQYVLNNAANATSTTFRMPSGGSGEVWEPSITKDAAPADTVTYSYETVSVEGTQITRPTEALAPSPAGVTCPSNPKELKPGCRALVFKYATTTKAKGENESEWGEYNGRLKEVLYVGYSTTAKGMVEPAVARYEYDNLGRLRAEGDPRVTWPLRTIYGYDAEGHLTAMTPPGQETWAFVYGTAGADANPGRLVKVNRAPASEALWAGSPLKLKTVPKITGTSFVGDRLAVNEGKWTNGPIAYGYQWESCNLAGKQCALIPGATNPNYTVAPGDFAHILAALVTATNGGGSLTAKVALGAVHEPPGEYPVAAGSHPSAITLGPDGNMWFTEEEATKIGKVTNGGIVTEYPLPSEDEEPDSIATGPDGNLWVAAYNGIIKVAPSGTVAATYPLAHEPARLTVGPDGNIWFTEGEAIGKMTTAGATTLYPLPVGSGASGITTGPDGNLWFTESKTSRIGKITTSGALTEYPLAASRNPRRIVSGPDGNLWFVQLGTSTLAYITTAGAVTEEPYDNGLSQGLTVGPDENLWGTLPVGYSEVARLSTVGGFIEQIGVPKESYPWEIAPGTNGNMWYTEILGSKVGKVPTSGFSEVKKSGSSQHPEPGWTIEYSVPLTGTGLPAMSETEVAKWGQTNDLPAEATAIFPPDEPQGWPASGYKRASIYYMDSKGRTVNVANPGGGISTSEYNSNNDVVRSLTPDNRATALAEKTKSTEVAKLLDSESTYNSEGTELLSVLGPQHSVRLVHGKTKENEEVLARNHTVYSYDEGAPGGGPYRLVTKITQGAKVNGEADRDVRTTTKSYAGQAGRGWELRSPTAVTADPSGLKLTHTTLYEGSTGSPIETRGPASTGEGDTHDTKTIYYTAAANETYKACGGQPQWANLPCEAIAGKQPEPALPVTITTYNMWDEPVTITRTVGSATRTTTMTYDPAGRPLTSETTSTEGKAVPSITDKYSITTGQLIEQSGTLGAETKTTTSSYNNLGQLVKYTDAGGNTAEYEYEPETDARLTHVTDGKGAQAYSYDETTGALAKLVDTQATSVLTFNATHDVEGNIVSETYPNGMTASYLRNATGEATGVTYEKTTHCTERCVWFTESVIPSIHDQTLEQVSSLAKDVETYDESGRLTQALETPTGEGCTTRLYEYDEETNRKKLTTRAPGTGGACASEGGVAQAHTYDTANRMTDTGTAYDVFGDITKLSAADAGGTELQSSYYVDGQLSEQKQGEQAIGYQLDPSGRPLETVDTGAVNSTFVSHYAGPGSSPSWTLEPASGHWTRYVAGIGGLAAIETGTTEPELQLTDLHGDVVAKAAASETATKVLSSERSTEYGVPTTTKPARYGWLGGDLLPTELPSGAVAMGVRSYVPQIGRFLQPDPIAGGSANAYAYTDGDPVNETDVTGAYVENGYLGGIFGEQNVEAIELEAAREAAARAEAERKAQEAAWEAASAAKMAAELAEREAFNLWAAEAAAGPPQSAPAAPTAEWLGIRGSGAVAASNVFSEGWNWVKKNVKKIIAVAAGGVSTAVIGGVTLVATIGCFGAETEFADEAECYKIAVFGAGFTVAAAGTTVKAWYSLHEQRP
jgi:RHS repeat-associated protein